MGIQIKEGACTSFHLFGRAFSYVIALTPEQQLVQVYYGPFVHPSNDFSELLKASPVGFSLQFESGLPYEKLSPEYGTFGKHHLKEGAFTLMTPQHVGIYDFVYDGYDIVTEKPDLEGLPSTRGGDETLVITLKSVSEPLALDLFYTVYSDLNILAKSSRFRNTGEKSYMIPMAMSGAYALGAGKYDALTFDGRWIKEFSLNRHEVHRGRQVYDNLLGVSTHAYQPYLAICDRLASETHGHAFGFALVYNGNHQMVVEKDIFEATEVKLGIHPHGFTWQLSPNEVFYTPEVISVFTEKGLGGISDAFHPFVLNYLSRGLAFEHSRVLVNSWEAMYFDISEEKLIQLGKQAHKLGMEMLVIDDGWFLNRHDDKSGLGNWLVDPVKFPNGLEVIQKETGLELGLWFEPEMTSDVNDPIIGTGHVTKSRNQYVLDFTNPSVVKSVFTKMCAILDEYPIRWIKWDANRPITEPYSTTIRHQGELYHRYQLGVYQLAQLLVERYPDLTIESCSAGGGRAGLGMFAYASATWLSDQTDAVERIRIQQAASLFLPLRSLGSHVTACPNHQVLRNTSLKMRRDVAIFGTFGYELNPLSLALEEADAVKEDILFFKSYRDILQYGRYMRLQSELTGHTNEFAHMVISKDKKTILVAIYQVLAQSSWQGLRLKLTGIEPEATYGIDEKRYTGLYLMHVGISITDCFTGAIQPVIGTLGTGDFSSALFVFKQLSHDY